MRRIALLVVLAATVLAPSAGGQTPPPPSEPRIADGVTIARVDVGGMTEEEAGAAVQAVFDQTLKLAFRKRSWEVSPATFGASPYLGRALASALRADPGTAVPLAVALDRARLRRYVATYDRLFYRAPRNSRLLLRNLAPYLTKARFGFDLNGPRARHAIFRALVRTERGKAIRLPYKLLRPSVNRGNYGPVIVIRRESRRLYLYRNMRFVRSFRIAVGTPQYPSPLGRYRVVTKERHPTWNPPDSPWAAGLGPVPPGPSNPLGTRWIGTSAPGIGIHGTPQPWTVGTAASHGCIRMYMREVEWLFERVRIGTPVFFVRA